MSKGILRVIGTGIRTMGHLTIEAIAWMKAADKLLYLVGDPIGEDLILRLNPEAESLYGLYGEGKPRINTYNEMIDRVLTCVREGHRTCFALYGHPGVFVYPSHESVRRARAEGYDAQMLPGISAEDCLFADLGVDPASAGCQSFEATDFLLNQRRIEPSSSLVLWQVGVIGDSTFKASGIYGTGGIPLLLERLYEYYRPDHLVYVYEAATLPGCPPVIKPVPLYRLGEAGLTAASTLYVPPGQPAALDLARYQRMLYALGTRG
ncbi:MAG TPA: SAM-dependent methyltransferase [Thermoanaerobaculia bacterium]|jgi:uncharacterized protein YabN with tetrapyrrole methylase and pyrophosphatase domain